MRRKIFSAAAAGLVVSLLASLLPPGRAQTTKVVTKLLHTIPESSSMRWSPDNKTLATATQLAEGRTLVVLYDMASGKPRADVRGEGAGPSPASLSFTPDGRALIVHTDRVRLYDAGDGRPLRQFGEGTQPITYYDRIFKVERKTTFDSDPGSGYESVYYDYPSDEEELKELPTRYVEESRSISPDGKSLLVRAAEGRAQVYDLGTGELKFTLEPLPDAGVKKGQKGYGDALGEFSPDGKLVLTTHRNRTPRLWNAATGALVADLGPQPGVVIGARFSADGRLIATTTFDGGVVKIWDAATGKLRHTVGSDKDRNYFAAWSPANNSFVTKTRKWEVNIWDAETGTLVAKLDGKAAKEKFDDNLTFLYSPDGRLLLTKARNPGSFWATFGAKGKPKLIAHLWDARTGALVASLRDTKSRGPRDYKRDKFFWGPAGDLVITAGATVKIWDRRGALVEELEGDALTAASLSGDRKLLAVTNNPLDFGFGETLVMTARILVGKMPNFKLPQTSVWRIENN
ncbi:MAG TPA: WD40 repeat domain-containing protein [Pyrinomonadaceae bacterium]|nr:WD40 repeat domain-containing protein [Pyrinomonadaceae bacterium]